MCPKGEIRGQIRVEEVAESKRQYSRRVAIVKVRRKSLIRYCRRQIYVRNQFQFHQFLKRIQQQVSGSHPKQIALHYGRPSGETSGVPSAASGGIGSGALGGIGRTPIGGVSGRTPSDISVDSLLIGAAATASKILVFGTPGISGS
jgi:hypothetical protein